ncbi:hypothetical protein N3K66_007980 [Trichothecium roseum]|uniref:Uncharacterized protein n=1 Tax=Trichothecium roseum TaxID=47278 RepID=A0ACC0US66_9HYPO|nr:hypothetical protein N3K66_007980 [Trichothecium roseum]
MAGKNDQGQPFEEKHVYSRFFPRPEGADDKDYVPDSPFGKAVADDDASEASSVTLAAEEPSMVRYTNTINVRMEDIQQSVDDCYHPSVFKFNSFVESNEQERYEALQRYVNEITAAEKAEKDKAAEAARAEGPHFRLTSSTEIYTGMTAPQADRKRPRESHDQLMTNIDSDAMDIDKNENEEKEDDAVNGVGAEEAPNQLQAPANKRLRLAESVNLSCFQAIIDYDDKDAVAKALYECRPLNICIGQKMTDDEKATKTKEFSKWLNTQVPKYFLPLEARRHMQKYAEERLDYARAVGLTIEDIFIGQPCQPTWRGDGWRPATEKLHSFLQRGMLAHEYSAELSEAMEMEVMKKGNMRLIMAIDSGVTINELYIGEDLLPNWLSKEQPRSLAFPPDTNRRMSTDMEPESNVKYTSIPDHPIHDSAPNDSVPSGEALPAEITGMMTPGKETDSEKSTNGVSIDEDEVYGDSCNDNECNDDGSNDETSDDEASDEESPNEEESGEDETSEEESSEEESSVHDSSNNDSTDDGSGCATAVTKLSNGSAEPANIVHDVEIMGERHDLEVCVAAYDDSESDLAEMLEAEFALDGATRSLFDDDERRDIVQVEVEGLDLVVRDPAEFNEGVRGAVVSNGADQIQTPDPPNSSEAGEEVETVIGSDDESDVSEEL